jgi:hypothetical protein
MQTDKYNRSGIYEMKFIDCPLKYIGQTERTLNIRYKDTSIHVSETTHSWRAVVETLEAVISIWPSGSYKGSSFVNSRQTTRVEAGSNTSTVTLRVVGGDEMGSLKSETVKYDRESQGTRTRE